MSVPTASHALEISRKVKEEQKRAMEQEIDVDVQHLKERAEELIRTTLPDKQGYWGFLIRLQEIRYKDTQTVIDHFAKYMKEQGYMVPEITYQKEWWKRKSYYTIRFRPRLSNEEMDE